MTHYRVLGRYNGYTHLECRLETGRTHQIRVHMSYSGHPLLGGYGVPGQGGEGAGGPVPPRQKTHLYPPPHRRIPMTVECPLPDWFTAILNKLNGARSYKAFLVRKAPAFFDKALPPPKGAKNDEILPSVLPIEIKPGFVLKNRISCPPSTAASPRTAASTTGSPNTTKPGPGGRRTADHRGLPL